MQGIDDFKQEARKEYAGLFKRIGEMSADKNSSEKLCGFIIGMIASWLIFVIVAARMDNVIVFENYWKCSKTEMVGYYHQHYETCTQYTRINP